MHVEISSCTYYPEEIFMRTTTLTLAIALALGSTAALAQAPSSEPAAQANQRSMTNDSMSNDKMSGDKAAEKGDKTWSDNASARMAPLTSATFVEKAAQGGMTEVQASKLALQKSKNEDVKSFANHMVTDHSQANNELKTLASKKSLSVPTDLDAHHKAAIAKLSSKTGAEFDRAYAEQMSKDHDKTVALFKSASTASGVDPDLQAFAQKTVPTLEKHDQLAMQLNSSVDKGAAASTATDR
jgi:putative membrane protein